MTDTNPYSVPEADVSQTSIEANEFALHPPKSISIGRSISWISEGFGYFKSSAGAWILTCIVGFIIMMVLNIIPVINMITPLFTFVWIAGLMIGIKAQHDGGEFKVEYLFAGFKENLGSYVLLGFIMLVISMLIMIAVLGGMYLQIMGMGESEDMSQVDYTALMGQFGIAMLALIPLFMATWFAPLLIAFNKVGVIQAMKLSFMGCLKNLLPLFVYGIIVTLLMVIAAIPLFLGLLVLMPTIYGAMFVAYKDIFID